jgi:hypothetical protein
MLRGFLNGLATHLQPQGEGWLILSDLAEHLGLRSREALLGWIAEAGLRVLGRIDTRPRHGKATGFTDTADLPRDQPTGGFKSAFAAEWWRGGCAGHLVLSGIDAIVSGRGGKESGLRVANRPGVSHSQTHMGYLNQDERKIESNAWRFFGMPWDGTSGGKSCVSRSVKWRGCNCCIGMMRRRG